MKGSVKEDGGVGWWLRGEVGGRVMSKGQNRLRSEECGWVRVSSE